MSRNEGDPLESIRRISGGQIDGIRFAEAAYQKFETSLDLFQIGDVDSITLFKGDFRRLPPHVSLERDEYGLEYLAGVKSLVRAGILISGFYPIFRDYLRYRKEEPAINSSFVVAHPLTDGLKNFVKDNTGSKAKVISLRYDISELEGVTEIIVADRYFDPKTCQPISDIWFAYRTRDLEIGENVLDSQLSVERSLMKPPVFRFENR